MVVIGIFSPRAGLRLFQFAFLRVTHHDEATALVACRNLFQILALHVLGTGSILRPRQVYKVLDKQTDNTAAWAGQREHGQNLGNSSELLLLQLSR